MTPALFEIGYTLVTVGLLSFFFYISLKKKWGLRQQILWWVLFGFIFNLYSLSWLYTVYPLIWMPTGVAQLFGIVLLHVVLSVSSGLCFLVVGCAMHYYTHKDSKPLIIGFSFVLAEILRSLVISLLYLGEGTRVGLHFTAGTLGNALSTTPLVELAYYGGTFALTFFITYLLYALFTLPLRRGLFHLALVVALVLYTHYIVPIHLPSKSLSIGVVTTDIPTLDGDALRKDMASNNQAVTSLILGRTGSEDILVLPEDARFLSHMSTTTRARLLQKYPNTLIVDGDTMSNNGKLANLSVFLQTNTGKRLVRGKELLLPFNEYIPFVLDVIFRKIIGPGLTLYEKDHTYVPMYSGKSVVSGGIRVGTIICSEILSFSVLNALKHERPDLVFYQSRLNVFNNSPWFLMHTRSFSKIAAVQLRTTIISSNNYAPSYIISAHGNIVDEIPLSTSYTSLTLDASGKVILRKE